jgi:hypothetical protein
MNALICDLCEAKTQMFLGGKDWREVKPMNEFPNFGQGTQHICPTCWDSMVYLRKSELP